MKRPTAGTTNETRDALSEELNRLELAVTDAVVPGELQAWCGELAGILAKARPIWERALTEQREALRQVLDEDVALSERAEAVGERFVQLDRELWSLEERTRSLLESDLEEPTASAEPTGEVEELRERSLAWIVGARAGDGEVTTLLQEAIQRDRGVVD